MIIVDGTRRTCRLRRKWEDSVRLDLKEFDTYQRHDFIEEYGGFK